MKHTSSRDEKADASIQQGRDSSHLVVAIVAGCAGLLLLLSLIIAVAFGARAFANRASDKPASVAMRITAVDDESVSKKDSVDSVPPEVETAVAESDKVAGMDAEVPMLPTDDLPLVPVETEPLEHFSLEIPDFRFNEFSVKRVKPIQAAAPPELQRIDACTLEQWTLPEDEEIVRSEIQHWDEDSASFQLAWKLNADGGRLKLVTEHSGLGQPIALFQLNSQRRLESVASKWELDQKADWLFIKTNVRTYLLALGREPSQGISGTVGCDVFGESEPFGSDERSESPYDPAADGGSVAVAISTFRANHIVAGNQQWAIVPPFSQSQLTINEKECLPWDEVQRSSDGLSYDLSVTTQADWKVAVYEDEGPMFGLPRERRLLGYEMQRIKIRSRLNIQLTSTLDDRRTDRMSATYHDEISWRSRELLRSRMRRYHLPLKPNRNDQRSNSPGIA